MWSKITLMLGLSDEPEYDDYEPEHPEPERVVARERTRPTSQTSNVHTVSTVSTVSPEEPSGLGPVRPISGSGPATVRPQVRPVPVTANAKPHVVVPESFNQAQAVADGYKLGRPVVMNLQQADRELARRLIDFASGLCYGLGGQMERVANQVYLLTPTGVEVSAEERRRLDERGYDGRS